jgi:hypothetical protein
MYPECQDYTSSMNKEKVDVQLMAKVLKAKVFKSSIYSPQKEVKHFLRFFRKIIIRLYLESRPLYQLIKLQDK